MLPSLDNFLSYGADVFKARPEYCKMVFDIYKTAMESATLGDNDRVNHSRKSVLIGKVRESESEQLRCAQIASANVHR